MYVQPFLFTGIGIIGICFVLILIAILFLYFRNLKAFSSLNNEFTLYKKENEKKAQEALVNANAKAQEIIKGTQLFTDEMRQAVGNAISQSASAGQSTYKQILDSVGNKSVSDLIALSTNLQSIVQKQAEGLSAQLKQEVNNEKASFHASLEKGEKEILDGVQKDAMKLLPEIIKEAAGKALTKEESEKLVIDALTKIKKEHGFS